MKTIDATDLRIGRLASYSAKAALDGEQIAIVNAEKAVLTGRKQNIVKEHFVRRKLGTRYKGPFYPKRADRMLKRAIRGMLPYKKATGKEAFKRIKVYMGIPEKFQDREFEVPEGTKIGRIEKRSYMTLGELSERIGAK